MPNKAQEGSTLQTARFTKDNFQKTQYMEQAFLSRARVKNVESGKTES